MDQSKATMAQQLAQAACAFEQQRTGHVPQSVTVVLSEDTLVITLLIASPMLLIGLVVGVFISILQAITQIQEQTLTLIPKIAAMVIAAAVLLPWIATRLMEYSTSVFTTGFTP